jgi:hypothetical protein
MSIQSTKPRPDHRATVLAHQQTQAEAGPRGRKLSANIGPGMLRPGAGKQVQRTQQPMMCGTMTGHAFDATDHPNSRDASRTSTRFVGRVMAIGHDGKMASGAEWYLPPTVGRAVKAALKVNGGQPVPFSIEVWCEPDDEGRPASPLGYAYVSYDRIPTRDNDPLMMLAYEAGILERPSGPALAAPSEVREGEEVDPETGEIRQVPSTPVA